MAKLVESVLSKSRASIQMAVVESDGENGGGGRNGRGASEREGGNIGVAVLLAIVAVVAALIGTRASMVSGEASDAWQSSLRTEEKRAAGAMNDIGQVYQVELPLAVRVLEARLVADEMGTAAQGKAGTIQQALQVEADVQSQLAELLGSQSDLTGKPVYALPSGGVDLGRRLSDVRSSSPDLAALDPAGIEAGGDQLANKALLLTLALLPVSLSALLGVLAQPLRRYRFVLLGGGSATLAAGAVMALAVEVLA